MARRLLMISTDRKIFEDGSAVRARQIKYAKDQGEVHIIVFAGKGFKEQALAPNCWAYPTRSWSKFLYPFDAMRLGRFVIENKGISDITCQDASLTAMAGLSLKKSAARRGKDLTLEIQVHEDIGASHYAFNATNKIRKTLALSYLPKADSIRVVSERIKKYLVGTLGIADSKITVRPIYVDVGAIKNAPIIAGADLHKKYPQFDRIVLMVGRLEPEKNVGLAIDSWPLVIERFPKAGLVIIGDGSLKCRLERQAKGLKASAKGSVIFEDWVEKAKLFSYYKTADLFLNTSLFEGYGMALVEAHAAGCRIVSTDVGIVGEILKDGNGRISIVKWNTISVANGISEALA